MTKHRKAILKRLLTKKNIFAACMFAAAVAASLGFLFLKQRRYLLKCRSEISERDSALANLYAQVQNVKDELQTCQSRYIKKVELRETAQGGHVLYVKGKPFLIRGVGYNPIPIGKGYDYDFFASEKALWSIDGELIKAGGFNCIRIYSAGKDLTQVAEFIRYMYENYGIYTIMSDWLGLWDHPRANYADSEFRETTKKRVLKMVSALKNEEGLLMWILGNENNYTFSGRIGFWTSPEIEAIDDPQKKIEKRAEIYYSFVNELALAIKQIDPVHPVALGNGEEQFLTVAAQKCPDVDILAIIAYRGKKFFDLFERIHRIFNKPIILSEFGCDSFNAYKLIEDQDIQADFILSQWEDLYRNTTFSGKQSGNVIGGFLFEWTDEWWKHNEGYRDDWSVHNTEAGWQQSSYFFDSKAKNGLNMNEEWFGIV